MSVSVSESVSVVPRVGVGVGVGLTRSEAEPAGLLQLKPVQIHIVTRIARCERHIQLMDAAGASRIRRDLPIQNSTRQYFQ